MRISDWSSDVCSSDLKARPKRFGDVSDNALPEVTVLVAAYNEEQCIEDKIANTLNLDYPKDKLSVFIVTDGSTDNTPLIVKKFHAVNLFHDFPKKDRNSDRKEKSGKGSVKREG